MSKEKIIKKIKLAEEIAKHSGEFKKEVFGIVFDRLLLDRELHMLENGHEGNKRGSTRRKIKKTSKINWSEKIDKLINNGFFDEVKTNKDILNELKLLGYKMKRTSLPSYLLPRLRKGDLSREPMDTKTGKIYGYVKKGKE